MIVNTIKQFDLAGVYTDLQIGKKSNFISSSANSGALTVQASDNSTLANLFVAEPTAPSHAATKNYVDNAIQGLDIKSEAQAATTANITATYNNGTAGVGATLTTVAASLVVDGYTVVNGDRIIVKNQTDATQNGIYTVSGVGSAVVLTRTPDADTGLELNSAFAFVSNGSTNSNTGWVVTSPAPITIGTTNITLAQFSGAGSYTAGAGLTLTGGAFRVNTDGSTTAIIGNNVVVAGGTAGKTLVSTGATEATWGAISLAPGSNAITGTLPVANGGTGAVTFKAQSVLVGNGTSAISDITGTAGQILLLDTFANPSFGNIDLSNSATVGSTILGLANGGTNAALSAVAGAVTYSTSGALALSAAGTAGQVLLSGGTSAPTWSNISAIAVTTAMNEGGGYGWFDSSNSTSSTLAFKTLTNTDSSLTITANSTTIDIGVNQGDLNLNNLSGVLDVTKGGTGLSSFAANSILYTSAANVISASNITSLALTLLGDSTTSAMQSTLGLVIGTDVQAYSPVLSGVAALSGTGFVVQTGADTFADRTITVSGAGNLAGLAITNGDGVSAGPNIGLDIADMAAGTVADGILFPVYDGTNNVTVTMAEIAAQVKSDNFDPLFRIATLSATGAVGAALPANAYVNRIMVKVTTAFSVDGITVESAGGELSTDYVSAFVDMTTPGTYIIELPAAAASTGVVTATITGTGGSCVVDLNYAISM